MVRISRQKQQIVCSALAACGIVAGVGGTARRLGATPAEKPKPSAAAEGMQNPASSRPLTEDEKIVHVLNRLGFGPRPGDVQKIKAMGLPQYITLQLTPERIDDSAVDRKLAAYPLLQLSSDQLATMYHDYLMATKQALMLRKQMKRQMPQADGATAPAANANEPAPSPASDAAQKGKALKAALANMDPQQRQELRMAREELQKTGTPIAQAETQFVAAKALRAVESERQLQEAMVDFWSNHFNIDIRKSLCGILKISDDRDAIRPHALGKFRDLLGASAKSPAMLVYLDNYQSTTDTPQMAPMQAARRRRTRLAGLMPASQAAAQTDPANPAAPPLARKKRGGLNENYAREIMELHTLGVDGGYTQKDVTEVARCLTGWGLSSLGGARRPGQGKYADAGSFQFHPTLHDNGEKIVLGHVIPAGGGERDGEMVLDILASHPATMQHVSLQLCQRLVADNPPQSLVDKCVTTWKRTNGDIREIMRTIATSPEFNAPTSVRSKIKSPFEYAVSSVRALGGTYNTDVAVAGRQKLSVKPPKGGGYLNMNTTSLVGQIGTMGEPLFQYQAPTGYPEDSRKWVSSGALISRLNFSLALTEGKLTEIGLSNLQQTLPRAGNPNQLIDQLAGQILNGSITPSTRATLLKQVSAPSTASDGPDNTTATRLAALMLGSPEFQRR